MKFEPSTFDLSKLIKLRQEIHKYPEIYFKEVNTGIRIKTYLKSLNIPLTIKQYAKTGFAVDINGLSNPSETPKIVAFRSDLDALEMFEENFDLEYRSKTKAAHMCGHDGHIVSLLGGIHKFIKQLPKIPQNHTIRLIFQPAEEYLGGAKKMVEEGVLEGVKEIWGLHNIPFAKDKIYVKSDLMMYGGI